MYQGATMGWKATRQPTVRQQRDKWVVRVDGIDTETWSEAEVGLSLEALGHRFAVDCALQLVIEKAGVPRLSSHGLRHTAATHMVKASRDVGELRTVADVLAIPPTC
jgi:site-specific recombinase XerC